MFRNIGLGLLFYFCCSVAALADSDLEERKELGQKVKNYQEAKNCSGMIGLYYTEGMDAPRRKAFTKTIEDYLCAEFAHPIRSVAFQSVTPAKQKQPEDFNGKHSVYTLKPIGVIVLDYGPGKPGETRSLSFLYGEHDGKDYLITTRNADDK